MSCSLAEGGGLSCATWTGTAAEPAAYLHPSHNVEGTLSPFSDIELQKILKDRSIPAAKGSNATLKALGHLQGAALYLRMCLWSPGCSPGEEGA